MGKTDPADLIREIADDLVMYLKQGTLNPNTFVRRLGYNIASMDRLLRVHFVLQEPVVDFVRKLPYRLQRIKTSSTARDRTLRGEVRGRVNWPATLRKRASSDPGDSTVFCCRQTSRNYDIKENQALRALLSVIHRILTEDRKSVV